MPSTESVRDRGPVADRLYTASEVSLIVGWFGGNVERWYQHVEADSDVVNIGRSRQEVVDSLDVNRGRDAPTSDPTATGSES